MRKRRNRLQDVFGHVMSRLMVHGDRYFESGADDTDRYAGYLAVIIHDLHFKNNAVKLKDPTKRYCEGFAWAMSAIFIENKTPEMIQALIYGETSEFDVGANDACCCFDSRENQKITGVQAQ